MAAGVDQVMAGTALFTVSVTVVEAVVKLVVLAGLKVTDKV